MVAEMMKLVDNSSPIIGFYAREFKRMPLEELTKMITDDPYTSLARCFVAGRSSLTRGELHATTITEAVEFIIKEHEGAKQCTPECQSSKLELVESPGVVAWVMQLVKAVITTSDTFVVLQAFAYFYRAGLIVGRSRALHERIMGTGDPE